MPNSPRRASTCELVLALMPNNPISTATARQVRHGKRPIEHTQ